MQDRLVGEKLIQILKQNSPTVMMETLRVTFDADLQWELEDGPDNFVTALGVILNVDATTYETFDQKLSVIAESTNIIEENVKQKAFSGNAIVGWPRGKQIVQNATSYLAKARLTNELNADVEASGEAVNRVVSELSGSLDDEANAISNVKAIVARLYPCVDKMVSSMKTLANEGVAEAALTFDSPAFSGPIKEAMDFVIAMYGRCLRPVFRKEFKDVAAWSTENAESMKSLALLRVAVSPLDTQPFPASDAIGMNGTLCCVERCKSLCDALKHAAAIEAKGFAAPAESSLVMKELRDCLKPCGHPVFDVGVALFEQSEFMKGGFLENAMISSRAEVQPDLEKLKECFAGVPSEAKDCIAWVIDHGLFTRSSAWAAKVGDNTLALQIECLHGKYELSRSVAKVEQYVTSTLANDDLGYVEKKISPDAVGILRHMRSWHATLKIAMEKPGAVDCFKSGVPPSNHYDLLDACIDAGDVFASLTRRVVELQHRIGQTWVEHAASMAALLEKCIPHGWLLQKDELMDNDELCQLLASNKEFAKIGPLATDATGLMLLFKKLHKDGHGMLIEAPALKLLQSAIDDAISTACFTYAVVMIRREWPKWSCEKVLGSTSSISARFTKHSVPITKQISDIVSRVEKSEVNMSSLQLPDLVFRSTPAVPVPPATDAGSSLAAVGHCCTSRVGRKL